MRMNTAGKPELVFIYREVVEQDTYNLRTLARLHPEIKRAVDIGASFGPASKFIKILWPDADIHAFEPDYERFKLLEENMAEFSGVKCHNIGLVGEDRQHVGFDGGKYRKSVDIAWATALCVGSGKSVDYLNGKFRLEYVRDYWPDDVDLLKIDVEGFEWGIIEDLAKAQKLPKIIIGEWHFNNALAGLIQLLEPTHQFEFRRPDSNPWGPFWAEKKKVQFQVDETLLDKVRDIMPKIWMAGDHFQCNEVAFRYYATKATICQRVQPKKILEIGTRCGYSVVAMHLAAPDARFICVDAGVDADSAQTLAHAKSMLREQNIDADIIITNSHNIREIPAVDFAHVDGDHTYEGTLADLNLVAHVPTILVDDCCEHSVLRAVKEFSQATNRAVEYFYDGLRDGAIIT